MKVGFIDHHLNNYHANKFHTLLTGEVGNGQVEIVAAWESDATGDDWCKAKNVPRAASPSEVVEKSDAIIILGPDNPESHLALSKPALDSKKPVYIDKFLSSNLDDAKEILKIAETHGTSVMSSSALRFSLEFEELLNKLGDKKAEGIFSRGFGQWPIYTVHTTTPAVHLMGGKLKRIIETGSKGVRLITLDDGERRASIEMRESENQMDATPWQIGVLIDNKYEVVTIKKFDEFYANLMKHTLEFFKTRKSELTNEEMLMTVAIEVYAEESRKRGGEWVEVKI